MKNKSLILAAAAAILAASCAPKVSDTTTLNCVFSGENIPDKVTVLVPGKVDTIVAVEKGKATVKIPADIIDPSVVKAGDIAAHFISDGTVLTATFNAEDKTVTFSSKKPKASVQMKNDAFKQALADMQKKYQALADTLKADDAQMDSLYDCFEKEYLGLNKQILTDNKNNVLAIEALNNVQYDFAPEVMDSIMHTLDSSLYKNKTFISINKNIAAKKATAEGQMFTDFDVNGVKLSDFVGKGKYMLVDFWASWCGPCKAEIPNVRNVYEKYAGNDFDVLSVAVWDRPEATVDTAKARGVIWKQMVGNNEKVPTELYGIQGIPHMILFGPDGKILKRDLRGEGIEEEVAKYVQPKK